MAYNEIRNSLQRFQALTSYSVGKFDALLIAFESELSENSDELRNQKLHFSHLVMRIGAQLYNFKISLASAR